MYDFQATERFVSKMEDITDSVEDEFRLLMNQLQDRDQDNFIEVKIMRF